MKKLFKFILLPLALSTSSGIRADDLTATNLTIHASAAFGTAYTGLTSGSTESRGFHISVVQGTAAQEISVPFTVEGHYEDSYVTVEEYGWVGTGVGYYSPQYAYGQTGTMYIPPVYDSEGMTIEVERWDPVYGDIHIGDIWIEDQTWAVTGTHTDYIQTWVEPYQSFYTDYQYEYDAPKIQFTATRSDANWAWQVPTESGGVKDVLVVWNGGLRVPGDEAGRMMALTSDSLTQSHDESTGTGGLVHFTRLGSHQLEASLTATRDNGAEQITEESTAEMKAEALVLTRVEKLGSDPAVSTSSAQTQIAAKSAHFAGVVTVAGDVKVQGVLRVQPAGNLIMGGFEDGPRPVPPPAEGN